MFNVDKSKDNKKIIGATGWSLFTQVVAKIIPPISNMILARLFAPEVFGIIATITLVTSFAETFSEGGFQKYIIKVNYDDECELQKDSDVAFWTNIIISLILWGAIAGFSVPLCSLLGNQGLEMALIIACAQIPLSSLSTIHIAFLQKKYKFRKPFFVQLISSLVTLTITLVLAFQGLGFWSIIIGNISGYVIRVVLLSIKSDWRPHFYYSFKRLKKMFSFTAWILAESIAVWLTSWFDSFLVGKKLNDHDLGIYKNSQSVVNGLLSVPQNAITNVSLVALSKNNEDQDSFTTIFLFFQRALAFLLLPIGVGVFLYRDLAVQIIFGSGWEDAGIVVGVWSLASVLRILFVSINTPAFISKGKPRISLWLQLIDIAILVPTCFIFVDKGLHDFAIIRSIARLDIIIPSFIFLYACCGISVIKVIKNVAKPFICTSVMVGVSFLLQLNGNHVWWQVVSIIICALVYCLMVFILGRKDIKKVFEILKNRNQSVE